MLRMLFENNSVIEAYSLHEKYKLSPGQMSRMLRKFQEWGVIEANEKLIKLTEYGRQWLHSNRLEVFTKKRDREFWKHPTDRHSAPQLPVNSLYLPNFDKIDREFFRYLEREEEN